jgi:capsular exopolysaccharide synthesis family protein
MLVTIVAMTACAWGVVSIVTPQYTAEAALMVGDREQHSLDPQTGAVLPNGEITENEVEVVKSRRIVQMVIENLGLLKDPTINPALSTSKLAFIQPWLKAAEDFWQNLISKPGEDTAAAGPDEKAGAPAPVLSPEQLLDLSPEAVMSRTIDNMLRHLAVTAVGRSRVVTVSFQAADPRTAAAVANAVVDAYIQDQLNSQIKSSAQANKWLSDSVSELRSQVIDTDRAVQQRKAAAGIMAGRQNNLMNEQISSLSDQLTIASAERVQAEARLAHGGSDVPAGVDMSVAETSPVVQQLRSNQLALQQRIAESKQIMGEKNPTMKVLQAELQANTDAIARETARVSGAQRSNSRASRVRDLAVAHAREDGLRTALAALQARANAIDGTDVDIRAQEREAEANHNLFDRLLQRAKETGIEGGLLKADAHIVSAAEPPLLPSYPNKVLVIALAVVGGTLVGLLLVFVLENSDHGFRDVDQAEAELGVPALGYVPRLRDGERPEHQVIEHPFSYYSESIRSLYTSLRMSNAHCSPKIVLVASALPDEGKTAISLSLARLVARAGKRVLLIDADVRNPSLHRAFGVGARLGLMDHLVGKTTVDDVLIQDPESSALLLSAGIQVPNPTDMFSSDQMKNLLQRLANQFDLIVIDSAPLLAVSDTRNLCSLADKVLFVVRWQRTRIAAAGPALRHLVSAGGDVAGVVLSMANLKDLPAYSQAGYYQQEVLNYLEISKT